MKWKIMSFVTLLFFALAACQADEQGQGYDNDNNNIDQTRYGNNEGIGDDTGDGMNRDRNYTMDRDIEERNGNNFTNTRNQANQNNNNRQQNDRYDVAEEAADQISNQIDEIERAYVLTTDNNAYVAAGLNNNGNAQNNGNVKNNNNSGDELTDDVKKEIADIVKSVDNDVENVYVSTNPDFMDLTNNYVNDMNNGEPIEGFFDQMGNMIERLFPQNR
ncbi:YhcN/YlaJ family sporulation lipoprotein [Ornithinibacillus salinisoli]|uniref:YhcN/YlaJ family sporulation lipoprotein n=1 Tax=Ornithinibacillus salinisoli TaxID=1848459 RepID=A0ABW4VT15_9BACI